MAVSKLTEKPSVENVKNAARFVITQLETVGGSQVESVRRAGMEATVAALKDAGINDGYAAEADIGHKLFSEREVRRGYINGSGNWVNLTSTKVYSHALVPVSASDIVSITAKPSAAAHYAFLTSDDAPVVNTPAPLCTGASITTISAGATVTLTAPGDAKFILLAVVRNDVDEVPAAFTINWLNELESVAQNLDKAFDGIAENAGAISTLDTRVTTLESASNIKWCALGDDITDGVYSVNEDGQAASYTNKADTWAYRLARDKGWTFTNLAVAGTGFINPVSNSGQELRGWQVARDTDFSDYDLITVAYGINDYKADVELGSLNESGQALTAPTHIYSGIQSTITYIKATAKPTAKIILFTPLNARGYVDEFGTYADDYSLGCALSNTGTLKAVRDAIVECCNYYDVDYIDQTYSGVVNRLTLKDGLNSSAPDGVHPSLNAHELLAQEISDKIRFNGSTWDIVSGTGMDGQLANVLAVFKALGMTMIDGKLCVEVVRE